jgi:hypothetical protein
MKVYLELSPLGSKGDFKGIWIQQSLIFPLSGAYFYDLNVLKSSIEITLAATAFETVLTPYLASIYLTDNLNDSDDIFLGSL